jgi:hypothetical protein
MTNQLLDKPMAVCGELIECQGTANALGWHKKTLLIWPICEQFEWRRSICLVYFMIMAEKIDASERLM